MPPAPNRPIRVVVVDDSAVVRHMVSAALGAEPDIKVVGTAVNPYEARDRIKELTPDVITLDIEMPRMDGLTFLGILMRERPMPVVVMSSISSAGSEVALEALRLGAVDVLAKPGGSYSFGDLGPRLVQSIRAAAIARLRPGGALRPLPTARLPAPPGAGPVTAAGRSTDPRRLIVLGASTGGTEALRAVLTGLPDGLPPIVIVQHIPAGFSRAFADRLNTICPFEVHEAQHDEPCHGGQALIAPGDFHLMVRWTPTGYRTVLNQGPQVWHQRPAVDILFKSVPAAGARHVLAGVLTGMGKDGAEGMKRLHDAGARTFTQDEASSVVYGMPREAWEQGGSDQQLPLDDMPSHVAAWSAERISPRPHVHV